jgi:hypothetical protein
MKRVLLLIFLTATASAQEVKPARSTKRIVATRVATLPDSNVGPFEPPMPSEDSRGRIYLMYHNSARLVLFDSSGRFVTVIGRKGKGPGEFERPTMFVGTGDTAHVYSSGRRTVFDPANHKVVRIVAWRNGTEPVEVTSHRFVLTADASERGSGLGRGIEIRDDSSATVRTFGFREKPDNDPRADDRSPVVCAGRQPGTFWSFTYLYRAELWDTAGKRIRTFQRAGEWSGPEALGTFAAGTPWACHVDKDGLLWTMITIGRRGRYEKVGAGRRGTLPPSAQDSVSLTVIEVIDPARGVVLASQLFEMHLGYRILSGGRVLHLRENENGELSIDVLKLSIK